MIPKANHIAFSICAVLIMLAPKTAAQTYLSEITVEVNHQEGELKDLVAELEGNTGFTFAYLDQSLQNKPISLHEPSWQMDDLLKEVSVQAGVSLKRVGGSIAVANAEEDKKFPQLVDESVSQWSVTGSVFTKNDLGMPSASILLLDASDSSFVKGAIADDQGRFLISSVDPGTYLIQGRMVGFSEGYSGPFEVEDQHVSIDPMELSESTEKLDEVIIESKKPLFEQKIDRLVVNVEGSPLMAGKSVREIMIMLPGATLSPETLVKFNGKSGFVVKINNQMLQLNSAELYAHLGRIPSKNVKRVELITNPSSKYDAGGFAGIINIVLIENDNEGVNGAYSFVSGYGLGGARVQASGDINYRNKKLNVFGDLLLDRYKYHDIKDFSIKIQNPEYLFQSAHLSDEAEVIGRVSGKMGADYYLGPKTIIGVLGDFYLRSAESETDIHSTYSVQTGEDTTAVSTRINNNPREFVAINFNVQHQFDQQQKLDLNLDYLLFTNDQNQQFHHRLMPQSGDQPLVENIRISKVNPLNIWIGKMDYQLDIEGKIKFEAGAKATVNTHKNDIVTHRLDNGDIIFDPAFSFFSDMRENVLATYGSITAFWRNTTVKSGIRYERTLTDFSDQTNSRLFLRRFGNFFPSLYLEQKLTKRMTGGISYTSRIKRPEFLQFSRSPLFLDPRTFRMGNNQLLPAYMSTLRTTLTWNRMIWSIEYSQMNNEIWKQPHRVQGSDRVIIYPINFDQTKLIGANLSIPMIIADWWEMNTTLGVFQTSVSSRYLDPAEELTKRYFKGDTFHSFRISKNCRFELHGSFASGGLNGLTMVRPIGAISLSVAKEFGDHGGLVSLEMFDLFATYQNGSSYDIPSDPLTYNMRQYQGLRQIRISYKKNFGKSAIKSRSKRKGGAEEELKRL